MLLRGGKHRWYRSGARQQRSRDTASPDMGARCLVSRSPPSFPLKVNSLSARMSFKVGLIGNCEATWNLSRSNARSSLPASRQICSAGASWWFVLAGSSTYADERWPNTRPDEPRPLVAGTVVTCLKGPEPRGMQGFYFPRPASYADGTVENASMALRRFGYAMAATAPSMAEASTAGSAAVGACPGFPQTSARSARERVRTCPPR